MSTLRLNVIVRTLFPLLYGSQVLTTFAGRSGRPVAEGIADQEAPGQAV